MVTRLRCCLDSILTSALIYLGNCEISANKIESYILYFLHIWYFVLVALTSDLLSYNGMDIPLQRQLPKSFFAKYFSLRETNELCQTSLKHRCNNMKKLFSISATNKTYHNMFAIWVSWLWIDWYQIQFFALCTFIRRCWWMLWNL